MAHATLIWHESASDPNMAHVTLIWHESASDPNMAHVTLIWHESASDHCEIISRLLPPQLISRLLLLQHTTKHRFTAHLHNICLQLISNIGYVFACIAPIIVLPVVLWFVLASVLWPYNLKHIFKPMEVI
jgi:hypothetical protein